MFFKICIESPPCSGLNKILKLLEKNNNEICREPMYNWYWKNYIIETWKKVVLPSQSPLNPCFYFIVNSIFNKFSNSFQYTSQSRIRKKIIIFERSLYSDFFVLTKLFYMRKVINHQELKLIEQLFKYFISKIPLVNIFIRVVVVKKQNQDPPQNFIKGVKIPLEIINEYNSLLDDMFQSDKDKFVTVKWNDGETIQDVVEKINNIIEKYYIKAIKS